MPGFIRDGKRAKPAIQRRAQINIGHWLFARIGLKTVTAAQNPGCCRKYCAAAVHVRNYENINAIQFGYFIQF